MKERTELTIQSSWEVAFAFILSECFTEENVRRFLKDIVHREPAIPRGKIRDPQLDSLFQEEHRQVQKTAEGESYYSLLAFLNEPLVQSKLQESWQYESGEHFLGREVDLALSETMGHGLATINEQAQLFLHRGRKEYFPGKSPEEVEQIGDRARLLIDFLLVELKSKVSLIE